MVYVQGEYLHPSHLIREVPGYWIKQLVRHIGVGATSTPH
jgi:hypothetical protein